MDKTKLDEKSQAKLREQAAAEARVKAEWQGKTKPEPIRYVTGAALFFVAMLLINDRSALYNFTASLFFGAGLATIDYCLYYARNRQN